MTRTVVILSLLLAVSVGAEEKVSGGRADQTDGSVAAPTFPAIAKNQTRPSQYSSNLNDDPGSGGGDGYTVGACNCKRECRPLNPYTCKIGTTYDLTCRIGSGGTCETACTADCT